MKTKLNLLVIGTNWSGGVAYKLSTVSSEDTKIEDGDFETIKHIEVLDITVETIDDECITVKTYHTNSDITTEFNSKYVKNFIWLETHNVDILDILEELE